MVNDDVFAGEEVSNQFKINYSALENESDRGAVLVASSLIEKGLETLIASFLLESESKKDELFTGSMAPLSTLEAKISIACRMGLIRPRIKNYLNIFRKIRNDFAHNIETCSFDDTSVKNRLAEIYSIRKDSSEHLDDILLKVENRASTREKFILFFALEITGLQRASLQVERMMPLID